ncbi:MAG: RnfABCDGE type electron transport complex subunit D [Herpetosiphonaceae bacterium]|nr:RnfABCDGE type electron transport complex subunit D [Herpetosiphonaceae bacterium]
MTNFVDTLLNRITMYRLALYYLIFLLAVALLFSFTGVLPYDPYALLFSVGFLIAACWITNTIFAKSFGVPANTESIYISALILALIITPIQATHDLWFLGWAAVWAMASKYILAIKGKHLFNPVAFAVALTYLTINQSASWWVGNAPMLPFVLVGGLLVVRKIRRWELIWSFLLAAAATVLVFSLINRENVITAMEKTAVYSPLVFFAAIILTEPLTMPTTRRWRLFYGALIGLLSVPQFHIGALYVTPELAILAGNVFSFIVSPKTALVLKLKEKIQLAPDIYDFIFVPNRKLAFAPGQYMEWTLGHDEPDTRGNRRYFTLASSPTEDQLRLGVKFSRNSSTFKQALLEMDQQHEIVAQQIAGDFVLPNDPEQKCVFLAGGIGITPFRSMIKYLLDMQQRREIVLFYANRSINEIVYKDVLHRAQLALGIKTIYTITDPQNVPAGWKGQSGHITAQMIKDAVPDYRQCVFYISGPQRMVDETQAVLRELQIKGSQIKTDYFAGLAG